MDVAVDDFTVESTGQPDAGITPEPAVPETVTPDAATVAATPAEEDGAATQPTEAAPADDAPRDEQGRFAKKDKPRDNPIARINQLTAQKAEAERRAAEYEARLRQLEQARPAARIPTEQLTGLRPEPREEEIGTKYTSYAEFAKDLARWVRDEERAQESAAARKAADTRQSVELQGKIAAYTLETTKRLAERPDLKAAYEATASIPVTPTMQLALLYSERANDLADYLALHPEEYAQLAAESANEADPVVAAKWMRRFLEQKVSAAAHSVSAPKPPISAAKPPIKTVGSSPTPADPLALTDDLPIEEYIRRANKIDAQKRRGL